MIAPQCDILTGLSEQHLVDGANGARLHRQAQPALANLCQAAKADGIDIRIVSAFRSFSRQAAIWQAKMTGQRPVLNVSGNAIDISRLKGKAKLDAVLLYSALPGASRHHWGTEFDVYDAAAVDSSYQPKLQPEEYGPAGPFNKLRLWLLQHSTTYGFFLPYAVYQGGVAAEPWHISYQPLASIYLSQFNVNLLRQCLLQHPVAEQQLVLGHLTEIVQQYVLNICPPQP